MALLEIKDLDLIIKKEEKIFNILRGINFAIEQKEKVGIVGESGSGKTMTMRSVMKLLPEKAIITSGEIKYKDKNLLNKSEKYMENIRGKEISIIFQDATSALNPVYTVGEQISDVYRRHINNSKKEAREKSIEYLGKVAFPKPNIKANSYPHELSGGLCQRAIIAMSLICSPTLLIADEPTTGLDVTIQKQVLDLILEVVKEIEAALIFISHDIELVSKACNKIVVMYAGEIVEIAPTNIILDKPLHPYTKGLVRCFKDVYSEKMPYIKGSAPDVEKNIIGCSFRSRCSEAFNKCKNKNPQLIKINNEHWVSCHKLVN